MKSGETLRRSGFGTAECFAAKKAKIVIADLDRTAAVEAAGRVRRKGARAALGIACDVSDRDSVEHMVAQAVAKYDRIEVLVNNAGICPFVEASFMVSGFVEREGTIRRRMVCRTGITADRVSPREAA